MAKRYSSQSPFKGKPNARPSGGTVRYSWKSPEKTAPSNNRTKSSTYTLCNGPYDNLVSYVWEVDVSNGQHLAYVDCDYVD